MKGFECRSYFLNAKGWPNNVRYGICIIFASSINSDSIIREPAPIIFGALHLTMNKHFDMDEIFENLVSADASSVSAGKPVHSREGHLIEDFRRTLWIEPFQRIRGGHDHLCLV